MADTVETAIYRLRVEGQEQLDRLKTSLDGIAVSEEKVGNETRTTSQALQNRLSRMDPLIRAQEQYRKELESAARYAEAGIGTNAQRAAQIELATRRYNEQVVAIKGLSEAHVGLNAQGQALFHSIRSVSEQLALGVPPVQALTGQINHLSFAASGQGGLSAAFSQVAGMARAVINPVTLTIGVVAGLAAGAAAAALQFDRLQVSSQRALGGAGAATGTTVSDLNQFTSQNSAIIGTGLSNKEARALGEDFTRTGEIVISRLHGMSDAVVGFSNQTGRSMEDARKAMVEFALDPKKALEELSKVYGAFDEQTRRAVETLTIAGDKTGAFQTIIDSLSEKSRKAAENMGLLERAGAAVVNFLAGASSKPSGIESQIDAAKSRLNAAIEGASGLGPDDARLAAASQAVEKLSRELEKLQAIEQKDMSDKVAAGMNKISTEAEAATRSILPQINTIDQLSANIVQLNAAIAAGQSPVTNSAALVVAQQKLQVEEESLGAAVRQAAAVEALKASWGDVSTETAKTLENLKDQERMIKATASGTELQAEAAIKYKNEILKGTNSTEAAAIAAQSLRNSMLQASVQAGQIAGYARETAADWAAAAAYENSVRASSKGSFNFDADPSLTHHEGNSVEAYPQLRKAVETANAAVSRFSGGGSQIIADSFASGGINAALAAARSVPSGTISARKAVRDGGVVDPAVYKSVTNDPSSIISNVDQLYQLKNSQTSDKGEQRANLLEELAWLQSQPQSIAQAQAIIRLNQSLQELAKATDANTAAQEASLNPLYSGRGALHIGYYKAARGLDMVAQGPSSGDQVPFHAMVNGGEHIKITPAGQNNDNSKTIVNNNNFVFGKQSTGRRSAKQVAQGFGQMIASLS